MPNILSVTEATRAVKDVLEAEFPFLWVRGEVSGVSRPGSGHIYFTLTDGGAQLAVVWFKSAQWVPDGDECTHPVTGEVMDEGSAGDDLENGREVLVAGRIGVYEPRGVYQLMAELVQAQGAGDLQVAFEAMKRKLADAGYFDESRKKALPSNPTRVAVVTSPSGAAVRDFLRLAEERGTGSQIRIYPTLVQGSQAPKQIAQALGRVDADGWAEAVALIRGGGSLEDLWAFNTEEVADALFRMQTPVVCGVGHEPDVSIADYVADLRVATPSHAAQALWSRRDSLAQRVDELSERLLGGYQQLLRELGDELAGLTRGLSWFSPLKRLTRLAESFARETVSLHRAGERFLSAKGELLIREREALGRALGPEVMDRRSEELSRLGLRLHSAMSRRLDQAGQRLELAGVRLTGLNPELPLQRGYSLMLDAQGRVVTSVAGLAAEDRVDIRVSDGAVHARVTGTSPREER